MLKVNVNEIQEGDYIGALHSSGARWKLVKVEEGKYMYTMKPGNYPTSGGSYSSLIAYIREIYSNNELRTKFFRFPEEYLLDEWLVDKTINYE